jgi:hypothetical protein
MCKFTLENLECLLTVMPAAMIARLQALDSGDKHRIAKSGDSLRVIVVSR